MKNVVLQTKKSSLFFLLITLFCFASCSKKTAYISQEQNLAYIQNVTPAPAVEITPNNTGIAQAENTNKTIESPKTIEQKDLTSDKVVSPKKHKNVFASVNKLKEKTPKALKNLSADKLANLSLLASAAKGKTKAMIDGKLRIGIILILIGLLVGIIFGQLGYIISVIGVVFIVLWLIDYL